MEEEKNFSVRLEMRVKNAQLVGAREQLGLTAKSVAEDTGIKYYRYVKYEGMKSYPSTYAQRKICKFYKDHGAPIKKKEVFPIELKKVKIRVRYYKEREVPVKHLTYLSQETPRREISYYPSPEEGMISKSIKEAVEKVLSTLTPRQEEVLRMKFGIGCAEQTTKEIADYLDLSSQRINQIEHKAMQKIRHPSRVEHLKEYKP